MFDSIYSGKDYIINFITDNFKKGGDPDFKPSVPVNSPMSGSSSPVIDPNPIINEHLDRLRDRLQELYANQVQNSRHVHFGTNTTHGNPWIGANTPSTSGIISPNLVTQSLDGAVSQITTGVEPNSSTLKINVGVSSITDKSSITPTNPWSGFRDGFGNITPTTQVASSSTIPSIQPSLDTSTSLANTQTPSLDSTQTPSLDSTSNESTPKLRSVSIEEVDEDYILNRIDSLEKQEREIRINRGEYRDFYTTTVGNSVYIGESNPTPLEKFYDSENLKLIGYINENQDIKHSSIESSHSGEN